MERSYCGNPFANRGKRDCRVAALLAMTGSRMFQHFYRLSKYHPGNVPSDIEPQSLDCATPKATLIKPARFDIEQFFNSALHSLMSEI
ncbi:MAG: hypothetical protein ACI9KN_002471 [Gammaproteobacteria bacterium]|jgi:hypothetical protein